MDDQRGQFRWLRSDDGQQRIPGFALNHPIDPIRLTVSLRALHALARLCYISIQLVCGQHQFQVTLQMGQRRILFDNRFDAVECL